jgi:hypothetical protein
MQLDRLLIQPFRRITRPGRRGEDPAPAPAAAPAEALRGSGSWANEWAGAGGTAEPSCGRGEALDHWQADGPGASLSPDDPEILARGAARCFALLSPRDLALFHWLSDRLEAEAPACSLHASVAAGAILHVRTASRHDDPVAGAKIDFLIADAKGHPACALLRAAHGEETRHARLQSIMRAADLPAIDLTRHPAPSALWTVISETLRRTGAP